MGPRVGKKVRVYRLVGGLVGWLVSTTSTIVTPTIQKTSLLTKPYEVKSTPRQNNIREEKTKVSEEEEDEEGKDKWRRNY